MSSAGVRAETNVLNAPAARDVETVLIAVLASPQFRNSLQCSSFLRYVVKYSLSGEDHLLRERVIGHEVFHRAPDYETGEDPVVRIRAAEVRKRLAQYYQGNPGDLHIEIPSGSYRALFHVRDRVGAPVLPTAVAVSVETPEPMAAPAVAGTPYAAEPVTESAHAKPGTALTVGVETFPTARRSWKRWIALAATTAALAAGGTYLAVTHVPSAERVQRQFWGPWIDVRRPVLIAMGSNAVYRLTEPVADRFAAAQKRRTQGLEVFPPSQELATLHGDSFTPAENSFVALGDVAAVADIVSVLARHDQHFEERFPNDISFAELRGSPTILVGGYNNPTSMEMTKNLRFHLTGHNEIDDAQKPGRKWELHASLDSHDTEDYAILTRTLQQGTDAPVLSVAGMGQYGTEAAAEFITIPTLLAELDKVFGERWQGKNLQLVLHVRIHDFKPGRPEVVAAYSW